MMKFIEYSANALQSDSVSVSHKEVLIKQISNLIYYKRSQNESKTQKEQLHQVELLISHKYVLRSTFETG